MSDVFSLRLPKSLSKQIKELAKEEGVSMNLFISLALAEKVGAMQGVSYLEQRAARGSREKMLAVLAKAPDVEPEPYDRLDYDLVEDQKRPEKVIAENVDEDYEA